MGSRSKDINENYPDFIEWVKDSLKNEKVLELQSLAVMIRD